MYVVCYVTFLNSLELTYNLVILFFTDAALLWEVVRYPECDLCDGADIQIEYYRYCNCFLFVCFKEDAEYLPYCE